MDVAEGGNATFSKASDFSRHLEKRPLIHIIHGYVLPNKEKDYG